MNQIMIVEDDIALCNGISIALKDAECTITPCYTLASARELLKSALINLVILDVNLPDGNGFDLLKEIKISNKQISVIMLTVNDMETDVISGFELGADDYITKPFSLIILRARVNALLRKNSNVINSIKIDSLFFDFTKMYFSKDSQIIELGKTEQKLLHVLIENRGQILTRETLMNHIWIDNIEYVDENALSVAVKRLRDKLEDDPKKPHYIKTVYGIGYLWTVHNNE